MSPAVAGEASPPTRVELSVAGMTCASCAARVDKRLNAVPGVTASVNLVTGMATAVVPAGFGAADLIAAVEQAGYRAEVLRPRPGDVNGAGVVPGSVARSGGDAETAAYLRRRLGVVAACGWSVFAMFVLDQGSVRASACGIC